MRKHLAPSKESIDYTKIEWAGEIAEVELDKTDFQLLLTISQNARLSDTEIAEKLNISRKVVAYRIKKIIQQKIIYGFKPFLNGDLLNFKTYKFFLTLQSLTPKREKELVSYLNQHPNVIELVYCIGNRELELDVESPSIEVNHDLIRNLRDKFTEVIRDTEIMLMYKSYKYDYLPEGLIEIQEKI